MAGGSAPELCKSKKHIGLTENAHILRAQYELLQTRKQTISKK